ncbi:MAG: ASCH domain-containing protein [Eubacteriales bacterium]|nr:ASCH domain-containing protein [Eubacteriales bacterium]
MTTDQSNKSKSKSIAPEELLNQYNIAREKGERENFKKAWYFCNNQKDADELADLTARGIKQATTSLYYWYEDGTEPMPKPGELNIITDYEGNPKCIIETVNVDVVAFKDVSEEFAHIEGEGDKSLAYWRNAHIRFFTEDMKAEGLSFTEDMKVVCEVFRVVLVV